jgi:alpha-glucosidase
MPLRKALAIPQVGGEFLLGPDILVAAPPYPDKLDNYVVEFPSEKWYDDWTGQPVPKTAPVAASDSGAPKGPTDLVPLTAWIHPQLATLPVFVRGGTILPIAPLVQSANEKPQGPLTLRIYAGDDCAGHIYVDDGTTYAYKTGESLRIDFRCEITAGGLRFHLGQHIGSFPAWWREIRIEIYGWVPQDGIVQLDGTTISGVTDSGPNNFALTIPDNGKGAQLDLK